MDPSRPPDVRKGQGDVKLTREEFARRVRERFYDPAFDAVRDELDRVIEVAWDGYDDTARARARGKAGAGLRRPRVRAPGRVARDARAHPRGGAAAARTPASPRRDPRHLRAPRAATRPVPARCRRPFAWRGSRARSSRRARGFECDFLDLSLLTAQYGRQIQPCKACVSTAMPLCHWPCSCYPNHAMGQMNDWMNELYPRWVAAHGVMIVTPVYWYQAPSVLKLMIDRLVCADGGNPDPTTTQGKDPEEAKALELAGWSYPRHLAGRAFGVVVHGDAGGRREPAPRC